MNIGIYYIEDPHTVQTVWTAVSFIHFYHPTPLKEHLGLHFFLNIKIWFKVYE